MRLGLICCGVLLFVVGSTLEVDAQSEQAQSEQAQSEQRSPQSSPRDTLGQSPGGPTSSQNAADQAQVERYIAEQRQRLEKAIKDHGDASTQAREARAQLEQAERYAADSRANSPGSFSSSQSQMIRQYLRQMQAMADYGFGEVHTSIDASQQMMLETLYSQLKVMAQSVHQTQDKKARDALRKDLEETVTEIVAAQERHRRQQIARLEEQLAKLRMQSERKQSVDQILSQLLGGPEESSSDETTAEKADSDKNEDTSKAESSAGQ